LLTNNQSAKYAPSDSPVGQAGQIVALQVYTAVGIFEMATALLAS
jgi:electron transfer flavoprotein alpha subunit